MALFLPMRHSNITPSVLLVPFFAFWVLLPSASSADSPWFLMARHGECVDVQSLKRKVPDLGEVRDPYAFITLMRDKGLQVTVNETATPKGKVIEVNVPERELGLLFVTLDVCQKLGAQ